MFGSEIYKFNNFKIYKLNIIIFVKLKSLKFRKFIKLFIIKSKYTYLIIF